MTENTKENMHKVYSQNEKLTEEVIGLTYKHMKRWAILLVFREIKIKITVRYPVILIKLTQIKKSNNTSACEHVGGRGEKFLCIVGGSINWDSFLKSNMMTLIDSNYVYFPTTQQSHSWLCILENFSMGSKMGSLWGYLWKNHLCKGLEANYIVHQGRNIYLKYGECILFILIRIRSNKVAVQIAI